MRFLIDTFSPEAAAKILETYPAEGVTTNPAIICREGVELKPTLLRLREALGVWVEETDALCEEKVDEIIDAMRRAGKLLKVREK